MKIAIVDDLPNDAKVLEETLSEELEKLGVTEPSIVRFSSSEEFISAWHVGAYSLIFLDIFIGEASGIDLARHIRKTDAAAVIVFFSTSNDFAVESYEIGADYYLRKPLDREKVAAMLRRINFLRAEKSRFIELPNGTRLLLIEIMYTEKYRHTITFNLIGARQEQLRITHNDVELLLLPNAEFCTVGQGHIINFNHVASLSPQGFVMRNKKLIPIPRRWYKSLKDAYTQYCFDALIAQEGF